MSLLSSLDLLEKHEAAVSKEPLALYTYAPIDEASSEIRLLTLHQGSFDSPILVTLTNTIFTPEHVFVFEALSYTWGSPQNPVHISVRHHGEDGQEFRGSLSVTKNLGEALPFLRYEYRDRVLWIAAICVNQRDLQERSQQVRRMAELFSKATRVVAWLGPSTELTPVAIRCFDTITSNVRGDWQKETLESISNDRSWADSMVEPPFNDLEYSAMTDFLSSEWFERLWIFQEIRYSSIDSILLYGQYSIRWVSFRSVVYFLGRKMPWIYSQSLCNRTLIAKFLCDYVTAKAPLDMVLHQTKDCKCTDPRDRIYALLSLARRPLREYNITPDYSKSVRQVYADAFKAIVASEGNLDILPEAEMREHTEWAPTWAPDWSRPKVTSKLPKNYASGTCRGTPRFLSERLMQTEGTVVDSIVLEELFQIQAPNAASALIIPIAQELKRLLLHFVPTILKLDEFDLRSICRTLCGGQVSDRFLPPRPYLPDVGQTAKHIREILLAQENSWESLDLDPKILGTISYMVFGRSICRTSEGRTILAPKTTRQGDIMAVILGCSSPIILRPTQDRAFKVIGGAYCDELANGETLMGPLTDHYKLVNRFNTKTGGYYLTFRNSVTGNYQSVDPRLGQIPLPLGWRRVSHERDTYYQWFTNDITREQGPHDPRLTAEALRERGVDIQTFNLV